MLGRCAATAGCHQSGFTPTGLEYTSRARRGRGEYGWRRDRSIEPNCCRIGPAQQNRDTFIGRGHISSRKQGRERGSAAGFRDDPKRLPQRALRRPDRVVGDQDEVPNEAGRDRKHQVPDTPRRERVGSDATGLGIDGTACVHRAMQRRRQFRLDRDDPDLAGEPRRDAADQSAAADRQQQRIDRRGVGLDLQSDAALAEQGLRLVEGVDGKSAAFVDEAVAGGQRVGVAVAGDDQLGTVAADARGLGR
jgi:hypothetical protein